MGKHTDPTAKFADRRKPEYKRLANDRIRARHRALGPQQAPTLYDLIPDQFSAIKGAGPRY